jgi:hypothetical protein
MKYYLNEKEIFPCWKLEDLTKMTMHEISQYLECSESTDIWWDFETTHFFNPDYVPAIVREDIRE